MPNIRWSTYSDEALAWLDEHRPMLDGSHYTKCKVDALLRVLKLLRYNREELELSPSIDLTTLVGDDPHVVRLPAGDTKARQLTKGIGWSLLTYTRGGPHRQLLNFRKNLLYYVYTSVHEEKLWLRRVKMVIDALAKEDGALYRFALVHDEDWLHGYPQAVLTDIDRQYSRQVYECLSGADGLQFLGGTKLVYHKPAVPPVPTTASELIIHRLITPTPVGYKIIFLPKV